MLTYTVAGIPCQWCERDAYAMGQNEFLPMPQPFCLVKKFRMATHVLERRKQLRSVLKAAVDAEALKRGASVEGEPPSQQARLGSARAGAADS